MSDQPGSAATVHHVEVFLNDETHDWGWQCFTCGSEACGFQTCESATSASDEHEGPRAAVSPTDLDPSAMFEPYCLQTVHDGQLADDPDEWPCPVNCHDTRPWCECMCHGTDDDDDE